jgi:hypothetical protein
MTKHFVPFLVVLSCVLLFAASSCKAAIVWSDNFNDGTYNGWTVLSGAFTVEDGILKTGPGNIDAIRCDSYGPSTGTWSFDLSASGWTVVTFVGNSQQQDLIILFTEQNYYIQKINAANGTYSSSEEFPGKAFAWQHLNITRDQDGRICVYDNGTLVVDHLDTTFVPSSEFFELSCQGGQAAIDNIVVSDTVDIQPPASVPFYMQTWFLASVGAAVVAVILIVVLWIVIFVRHARYAATSSTQNGREKGQILIPQNPSLWRNIRIWVEKDNGFVMKIDVEPSKVFIVLLDEIEGRKSKIHSDVMQKGFIGLNKFLKQMQRMYLFGLESRWRHHRPNT